MRNEGLHRRQARAPNERVLWSYGKCSEIVEAKLRTQK